MSSSPSLKDEVVGKDSENASNSSSHSSNGEGGGNNSDNSALVSLGNTSFGFNFESDGVFNSGSGSGSGSNSPDEGDSDQGDRKPKANPNPKPGDDTATTNSSSNTSNTASKGALPTAETASSTTKTGPSTTEGTSATSSSPEQATTSTTAPQSPAAPKPAPALAAPLSAGAAAAMIKSSSAHHEAAATAEANLHQIATDAVKQTDAANEDVEKRGLKRKPGSDDGYKTDDEGNNAKEEAAPHDSRPEEIASSSSPAASKAVKTAGAATASKKKKLDDTKREERNAREKERSFRISKQINELRTLLSSGGVIVPKGTKSSVLTEAANYIRMLQQHQYRSEIDRHQLVQQVQHIGSGALGQQAAHAVRHVAAQNGVWSLGNFGGVPPKSAMMYHQRPGGPVADETRSSNNGSLPGSIQEADYRHVFNSCTIGMAIASMGGAFIDCNKFFCQISGCTKQEICSQTVFNLTARQDLQSAFDLISQMLSAPLDPTVTSTSCVLRGALKNRPDVGLSVKLIKANDGVAKCFCITLIHNPASPYDTSRPIPATVTVMAGQGQLIPGAADPSKPGMDQAPAYTAG